MILGYFTFFKSEQSDFLLQITDLICYYTFTKVFYRNRQVKFHIDKMTLKYQNSRHGNPLRTNGRTDPSLLKMKGTLQNNVPCRLI